MLLSNVTIEVTLLLLQITLLHYFIIKVISQSTYMLLIFQKYRYNLFGNLCFQAEVSIVQKRFQPDTAFLKVH